MKDSETPFHPEEIKDKTAEPSSIKNTIDQCSVKQTETELSKNLDFEVEAQKPNPIDSNGTKHFINAPDAHKMEIYDSTGTSDQITIDLNNKDNIDNVDKYHNDGLYKNSKFPTNEESHFVENKSVVFCNKDNPPDILMDTKEKDYMKLSLNTNTLIYHCKEDSQETVSKYKSSLEHRPASSSTSLDFITISEWSEQEDEERFRHHLANNPENPNFSSESTTKERKNDMISKENGNVINLSDDQNTVNEGKENDEHKKEELFDKSNEYTRNDREAPFSNVSASSKGKQ